MGTSEDNKSVSKFGIVFFHIFLILLFIIGGIATYIFVSEKIENSVTGINTPAINIDGENSNMVTFIGYEKSNNAFFIVFIICVSILIALTLILLFLSEQKYNKNIGLQNKASQLSMNFDLAKKGLQNGIKTTKTHKETLTDNNITIEKKTKKDNAIINNAIVDLFKAYSNSLPELQ